MIDNVEAAEAAHNELAESDDEYGRLSAYVKMAPHYIKLIKAKEFLNATGTVAEKEATSYASIEYVSYIEELESQMLEFEILEAKRASWQREVELWRTISANQRR